VLQAELGAVAKGQTARRLSEPAGTYWGMATVSSDTAGWSSFPRLRFSWPRSRTEHDPCSDRSAVGLIEIVRCRIRHAHDRMNQGRCARFSRSDATSGADALNA
jgi:hypothetical protein